MFVSYMIFISNIAFTSFLSVRKWIKLILRLAFIIYFLCPIYCGKRFPVSWESIPSFCGNKFPKYIGIFSHNIWDNQNECLSWTRKRKGMVSDYEKNIRQFISILQKMRWIGWNLCERKPFTRNPFIHRCFRVVKVVNAVFKESCRCV